MIIYCNIVGFGDHKWLVLISSPNKTFVQNVLLFSISLILTQDQLPCFLSVNTSSSPGCRANLHACHPGGFCFPAPNLFMEPLNGFENCGEEREDFHVHTQSLGEQIVFLCQISLFGVPQPLKITSVLQVIVKENNHRASSSPKRAPPRQMGMHVCSCFCSCSLVPGAQVREQGLEGLEVLSGPPDGDWGWSGEALLATSPHLLQRSQGLCWEATLCRGGDWFAVLSFPAAGCVFAVCLFFFKSFIHLQSSYWSLVIS